MDHTRTIELADLDISDGMIKTLVLLRLLIIEPLE